MKRVVCPHCSANLNVPEDMPPGPCPGCGQFLQMSETHVTAEAPPVPQTFQAAPFIDRPTPDIANVVMNLPDRYASWDEFRTLSPVIQSELMKFAAQPLPDLRGAERQALPEWLPPSADKYGRPLASCTLPGEGRFFRWMVMAFMGLMAIGLLLIVGNELRPRGGNATPGTPVFATFMVLFIAGLMFATWYGYLRKPIAAVDLWIFEEGLLLRHGGQVEVCAWEDIREFRTDRETGRPTFWLTTRGDVELTLSSDITPAIMPLTEYMKVRIASAQFLPKLHQIYAGGRVGFGAVSITRAGLSFGKFFAPWSDVDRVVTDDMNVLIATRSRTAWQPIRLAHVSFLLLLLAVAHVMIDEEKRLPSAGL